MRVHPSILAPKVAKWQFPLAAAVLVFLLGVNLLRGPRQEVVAVQAPVERKLQVLVAQQPLEAGQPLEKANLAFEERPLSTLPSDAVTSLDLLKGKVAAGPIPKGYPLAMALLAEPLPVVEVDVKEERTTEDPIEAMMREIERDTVAVSVRLERPIPQRGARVAVMSAKTGLATPVVVLEEAWVSRADGNDVTLRIDPSKALLFELARGPGQQFRLLEIPVEGPSPFVGKAPANEEEMRVALGLEKPRPPSQIERLQANKQPIRSYAWVPGAGVRYGIDGQGNVYALDQEGNPQSGISLPKGFGQ